MGVHIGRSVYKVRLAISGSSKGKSGGVRIITYVKIVGETVILAEIYLKNEYDTVDVDSVIVRLSNDRYI